jgi:hypothetical protein
VKGANMLNNIITYVLEIINYLGRACAFILGLLAEGIMFLTMFICGALGFGVFILFLLFMLTACFIAVLL